MSIEVETEDAVLGWGNSIAVPSVQELVRLDPNSVPERYIQKHDDRPLHNETCSQVSLEIPIINFALLASGDENELKVLDFACKEWGFFQVMNHGISNEVLKNIKAAVEAFFDLPLVEKKKYAMRENDLHGYGQGYVVSDDQTLDWNDLIFLMTLPPKFKNMKYWPTTIPGFKEAVELYAIELEVLAEEIFANLSLIMGMDRGDLKDIYGVMRQGMRMNYYPTCARPDLVLGVSPHSDASAITLLLQDDATTSLQLKHNGTWVPVKPIPNAVVVNVGDLVEAWSNGVYRSIEHRAITNEKKARISVATFVFPDDEIEIGPVDSMVDDDHQPRMYKNVKYVDYLRYQFSRKMEGKSNIDFLKLEC